ncbi:MAG: hypothetical protein JWP69_1680 [Flaviaesturariibacter sp.]|nr:hypothetical protein [Flaviaesturariibacter sp.]
MSKILLSYDVQETSHDVHTELKKLLKEKYHYSEVILSTAENLTKGKWFDLPNTTLIKYNSTPDDASSEFLSACKQVGARWEKYIVVDYTLAVFKNQEPSERK